MTIVLGRKIKHLLEVREMTQADLAKATGLHRNVIGGLVNGNNDNPTLDTLKKIAEVLRVSPTYFVEENAYTPLEKIDLPEHIKDFILSLDSMDYLIMAEKFKGKKLSPKAIEKIIETYEEVMDTIK